MDRSDPSGGEAIQSLWIGPRLPTLARLSIASFLAHRHPYHLYTYGPVGGVPDGAHVFPAGEILPEAEIFRYKDHQSYAGFANFFRYRLLSLKGGWWCDTDVICLKPFRFPGPHVFSSERHRGESYLNATVLRAPAGSPAMNFAVAACRAADNGALAWGDTGSRLIARLVDRFDLAGSVEPPESFCPLDYADWRRLLDGDAPVEPGPASSGLHLWHEMWRRAEIDAGARHDPRCTLERLKRRYPAR